MRGRQAHAAMPETGADALEAANAILAALYAERKKLARIKSRSPGIGSPKLNVGLISGGINTNVVPDRVTFRLDRRIIPEENAAKVEKSLIALIAKAGKRKGIGVETKRIMLAEPLKPVKGTERLVEPLQRHAKEILGVSDQGNRRAALYRRAPLRGARHPDRALWRRPALDPGRQRPRRRRARAAEGPGGGDQDRDGDAAGIC